jgi:hypothetical protein
MPDVYEELWQALKAENPAAILVSGYRPGAVTATGKVSYHSRKMAIDIGGPNLMGYFEWIASKYPNSLEVIYSPAGGRQIWNGQPHLYGEPTKGDHYDHVHWAANSLGEASNGGSAAPNTGASSDNPLAYVTTLFTAFTKPDLWTRIGLFIGGAVLVIITFLAMAKRAA